MNLEMGGKDPFIVCADVAADVGVAAKGGAWAAYLNAGQVCTSAERFYVAREVYDDFVSAFVDYTDSLRMGDPLDASTDVGPMVSAPQRAKVEAQLEAAVSAGATVVVGGDRAGFERGHFLSPAVVTGAPDTTELLREETFGPVAPIVPVTRWTRPSVWRTPRASDWGERVHARPRDRGALHARDPRRDRMDQRPAHRQ